MSVKDPLDPFSEVVDERRRWRPDWYSWLTNLAAAQPGSAVPGGSNLQIQYNNGGIFGGLTDLQLTQRVLVFGIGGSGAVPAPSSASSTLFLNANGTWTAPTATNLPDGDYGDIKITSGVWAVDTNVVDNTKTAQIASGIIKGRVATGTGNVQDLTGTQATTLLDVFTPSLKGLVPAGSGGVGTAYLNGVGGWAVVAPLTTLGDTLSHDGTNQVRIAGNITSAKRFLTQIGTGAVSALPTWGAIAVGDVPVYVGASGVANGTAGLVRQPLIADFTATKFLCADGTWAVPPGGGAPTSAQYLVGATDAVLTAERVVTNTASVVWDLATAGQAKATVPVMIGANGSAGVAGLVPAAAAGDAAAGKFLRADGLWAVPPGSGSGTVANPTATIGLTAVNGVLATAIRSDGAPPLSQAIVPTWTGAHTWSADGTFNANLNATHVSAPCTANSERLRFNEPSNQGYGNAAGAPIVVDVTNFSNNSKCGLTIYCYTTATTGTIKTTGLTVDCFAPPDNGGDCSACRFVQSGGGNGLSVYNRFQDRVPGLPAYPDNGYGIECGVDGNKTGIVSLSRGGPQFLAVAVSETVSSVFYGGAGGFIAYRVAGHTSDPNLMQAFAVLPDGGSGAPLLWADYRGNLTIGRAIFFTPISPAAPTDGEMWYDGANVKFRVGGTTKTFTLV